MSFPLIIRSVPICTLFYKLLQTSLFFYLSCVFFLLCCHHKLSKKLTFREWLLPHYMILGGKVCFFFPRIFFLRREGEQENAGRYIRKSLCARKTLRLWKSFLPPKAVSHLHFSIRTQKIIFRKTFKFEYLLRQKLSCCFFCCLLSPQFGEKVFCFLNFSTFSPSQTSTFLLQGWGTFFLVFFSAKIWFLVAELFLFTFTQYFFSFYFKIRSKLGLIWWVKGKESEKSVD